ncbi:MAG: Urea ABC transporter, ATPase protein UrtE, partial [uncultured Blastococcus sp.]
ARAAGSAHRLRAHRGGARRRRRRASERGRRRPGAQRGGQDDAAARGRGAAPPTVGPGAGGRRGRDRAATAPARPARAGLRSAGSAELSPAHGGGEPPARRRRPVRRAGPDRRGPGPVPSSEASARPARGTAVRRAAPATVHRPRAHDEPAAADPGRADGGHPAERGDRDPGGDPGADPSRRALGASRRAARRVRPDGREQLLRPGVGAGHRYRGRRCGVHRCGARGHGDL